MRLYSHSHSRSLSVSLSLSLSTAADVAVAEIVSCRAASLVLSFSLLPRRSGIPRVLNDNRVCLGSRRFHSFLGLAEDYRIVPRPIGPDPGFLPSFRFWIMRPNDRTTDVPLSRTMARRNPLAASPRVTLISSCFAALSVVLLSLDLDLDLFLSASKKTDFNPLLLRNDHGRRSWSCRCGCGDVVLKHK